MSEGIVDGVRASRAIRRRIAAFVVLALGAIALVAAVSAYWSLFGPGSGLPGEPLSIVTEPDPSTSNACMMARLGGLEMGHEGLAVVFKPDADITWPYGTQARLVDGKAQLFAPNGIRIGVEGQTLPAFAGGMGTDNRFHVCAAGGVPGL